MILFQENWKQEVRAYLRPFHVSTTWEDENGNDVGVYQIEVLDKHETARDGYWGEFVIGATKLHYLSTPSYGGEEGASITWALKSDFVGPLHFWAATALVETAFDSSESWFDYRQNPAVISPSQTLKMDGFAQHYWAHNWRPLPDVVKENEIRHWRICDEWNDQTTLFETEAHFILWNWFTSA